MDELKDFMDIRIATRCPLCGKRFKSLSIELDGRTPIWINSQCDCGLSLELDDRAADWKDRGESLDKWNRMVNK